ncbi:3,4-dihydroxy-2-butanone-4-phosphate synthase [Nocardia sp. NPDC052566]|uniref:3,4-dihydroxy-2-butanone-4-phosphate synthase n=1 Tax=Nocardia sp. NPDC052566 TaxID=3364330 RepID=UPI0037C5C586
MSTESWHLDRVETALAALASGGMVVLVDAENPDSTGDLVLAAAAATTESVAFMIRYTSGMLCVPLPGVDLDRLRLPLMAPAHEATAGDAYAVAVDAASGVSTGISALDRARTVRLLADPRTAPADLTRPGHVLPLRAHPDGVLGCAGRAEAAVDLTRLAGLRPAGVIAEVMRDDGEQARLPELAEFAHTHGLPIVSIAGLIDHRRRVEGGLTRVVATRLPTGHGEFQLVGYRDELSGTETLALIFGRPAGEDALVRLHPECLMGDVLGSLRCDCAEHLDASLRTIAGEGSGVVVYLRGQQGRGLGLLDKLRAYELHDRGVDGPIGRSTDARRYITAAQVLAELGIRSVRLLDDDSTVAAGLAAQGVAVTHRTPLLPNATELSA